jgi:hypothetical protein
MSEQEGITTDPVAPVIKRCPSMQGQRNPKWNGGTSEYQDHYLLKKARIEKLKSVQGKCEICGERAQMVHHIDGSTSNHDLSNFLVICHSCHRVLHVSERDGGGNKTSKYIRIYGMTIKQVAELTSLSLQKIQMWTESPKKRELIMRAIQDKENATKIVRETLPQEQGQG